MDSQVVTKAVSIICGDSRGEGAISVHHFSSRERARRAVKTGFICLAVVAVCACIPGAHFILVPLGLLTSPVLIARSWKEVSVISAFHGRCAVCHGELTRVNTRERYPLFENCMACHRENRILPTA